MARGFSSPVFARAKFSDSLIACRIDAQVKTSQALDGEDMAGRYKINGGFNGIDSIDGIAFGVEQGQPRSADRAGVGFGMKAPVGRIFVFGQTSRTLGKAGHGGVGAVIRNRLDDCQTAGRS